MPGHVCYHCKQFVAEGEPHDCWTTTEAALTRDLTPELRDAWERLRDAAVELGEQRIYASHNSIMFARRVCHFFVRPKRSFLELTIFLGRAVHAPQIRRVRESSRTKWTHVVQIRHRDEVEAPITDWMAEAYAFEDGASERAQRRESKSRSSSVKKPGKLTTRRSTASRGRTPARRSTASRSGRARRRARR
jgi:uncharacterized protein DUF5655